MDGDDLGWEKDYPSWIINKCFSSHLDTILLANQMNISSGICLINFNMISL